MRRGEGEGGFGGEEGLERRMKAVFVCQRKEEKEENEEAVRGGMKYCAGRTTDPNTALKSQGRRAETNLRSLPPKSRREPSGLELHALSTPSLPAPALAGQNPHSMPPRGALRWGWGCKRVEGHFTCTLPASGVSQVHC